MATEVDEKTWLNYSIGSAYLKLGIFDKGLVYGTAALDQATIGGDDVWLINSNVLVAHIKGKRRIVCAIILFHGSNK